MTSSESPPRCDTIDVKYRLLLSETHESTCSGKILVKDCHFLPNRLFESSFLSFCLGQEFFSIFQRYSIKYISYNRGYGPAYGQCGVQVGFLEG